MNAKFFGALLAAPLAVASAMIMAAPASAAVFFNNNDTLNFTGGFKAPAPNGKYEFQKVDNTYAAINGSSYGNFGIASNSTGAFLPFGTNSVLASNEILSVDFTNSATYLNKEFLKVTNGTDSFTFVITGLTSPPVQVPIPGATLGFVGLSGNFVSSTGSVLGTGALTSNFGSTSSTYSAFLEVTKVATVPEPSALVGLGLMVGTVLVIRRRQEVSA